MIYLLLCQTRVGYLYIYLDIDISALVSDKVGYLYIYLDIDISAPVSDKGWILIFVQDEQQEPQDLSHSWGKQQQEFAERH